MGSSGALPEVRNGQWATLEAEGRILGKNVENAFLWSKNATTELHPTLTEGFKKPTECPKRQTKTAISEIAFFFVYFLSFFVRIDNICLNYR